LSEPFRNFVTGHARYPRFRKKDVCDRFDQKNLAGSSRTFACGGEVAGPGGIVKAKPELEK
jgi:hypothetical protein